MPSPELAAFDLHIDRARDLAGMAVSLERRLTGALDLSDMYRASFVQGVSAFDTLIHAQVRARMLEIFVGTRMKTSAFEKFKVSLSSTADALASVGNRVSELSWLESEIREQHSYMTFQHPDKVADAIRLVSGVELWKTLALHLKQGPEGGEPGAKILKRRLSLIVDRRNTIVHESDLDPTPPGDSLYPMSQRFAEDALDFLRSLAHGIQAVI